MHYTHLAQLALFLASSTIALPFEHSDTVTARALDISGQCSQISSTLNSLESQIKIEIANWKGESSSQVLNLLSELVTTGQKAQNNCFSIREALTAQRNNYATTDTFSSSSWGRKRAQKSAPSSTTTTIVNGKGAGHSEGQTRNEKKDVKDDWVKFSNSFTGSDGSNPIIPFPTTVPWVENSNPVGSQQEHGSSASNTLQGTKPSEPGSSVSNPVGPSQEQGTKPDTLSGSSASSTVSQSQGAKPAEPGNNVSNTLNQSQGTKPGSSEVTNAGVKRTVASFMQYVS